MISRVAVAAPARRSSGGLGLAAAEFASGAELAGRMVQYVGPQRPGWAGRLATSRAFRRALGMAVSRRIGARAVRQALGRSEWDLIYATGGSAPVELPRGIKVVHQATRLPALEWEALRRAEKLTGGRGDMSRAERRRREYELERTDLIHVTSQAVRDEFLEAGFPAGKLVHAYLGVDLETHRPRSKQDGLIAFVGPLSMRKGVDVAAEVAARLRGEAVVEAVGGPSCPWSRRIVAGADFVHGESAAATLARSRALILPSRSDGFSYVVLEALAAGSVPIVTPAVGAAEVVERLDPRLVVEHAEFADAAVELIRTLDLEQLGRRARELARDFDRSRTAPAMAEAILAAAETQGQDRHGR